MTDQILTQARLALSNCHSANREMENGGYISKQAMELFRSVEIYAREFSKGRKLDAADVYMESTDRDL